MGEDSVSSLAGTDWLLFCGEKNYHHGREREVPTDTWRLPVSPRVAKAPHPPHSGTWGPRRTAFSPTQPFPPSKMEDILQKVEAEEEWGDGRETSADST